MLVARSAPLAAALALLGLTLPAASASAATPPPAGGWTPTATQATPVIAAAGSAAVHANAAPASFSVEITVGLGLRDAGALEADVANGVRLTPAQFEADFAPTPAQVGQVVGYLQQEGFTSVTPSANGELITADGTSTAADAAFHTTLVSFTSGGLTYFANTSAVEVPAGLGGTVTGVLGLNNVMGARVDTPTPALADCSATSPSYICAHTPPEVATAYDATAVPTASATNVAIFANGNLTQVTKDLATEEAANGLPAVPVTVQTIGGTSSDTSGNTEYDIDTQFASGVAGQVASLHLYDVPALSDADLAMAYSAFASDGTIPTASASFGECEQDAYTDGAMAIDDQSFLQAESEGKTVFVSSGDDGGDRCATTVAGKQTTVAGVSYPASSPYVVAVGGTTLDTTASSTYTGEQGWSGSGGGVSLYEPAPPWQATDGFGGSLVASTCGTTASCGRTVPDIAEDGDPMSGGIVYVNGTTDYYGGTSLSAPVANGLWARLETARAGSLGAAAPVLYGLKGTAGLHDVASGSNGAYTAGPGYDLVTGLGSLDLARAQADLAQPTSVVPEVPLPATLPAAAAAVGGLLLVVRRRRRSTRQGR